MSANSMAAAMRRRNRNPNCNHNNNHVFYQNNQNNVKYDDQFKRKEDIIKKLFFSGNDDNKDDQKADSANNSIHCDSLKDDIEQNSGEKPEKEKNQETPEKLVDSPIAQIEDGTEADKDFALSSAVQEAYHAVHNDTSVIYTEKKVKKEEENALIDGLTIGEMRTVSSQHKSFLLTLLRTNKLSRENFLRLLHEFRSNLDFCKKENCTYCLVSYNSCHFLA